MNKDTAWYKRMLEKYGSDEAISEIMSKNGKRVKDKRNAGFASIKKNDPERLKEISRQGVEARQNNEMAKLDE